MLWMRLTAALSAGDGGKEHERIAFGQPSVQTGHATIDEENQRRPLFPGHAQALQNDADGLTVNQRHTPLIREALGERLQLMVASDENIHCVTDIAPR